MTRVLYAVTASAANWLSRTNLERKLRNIGFFSLVLGVVVAGCAVMHDQGPQNTQTQSIALDITPETAQCQAFQAATPTGTYDPGQKVLTVTKSHDSLEILCAAPGFKDKRIVLIPDTRGTLGPAAFLLADFGPVDYFYSSYPDRVTVKLDPLDAPGSTR